MRRLIQKIEKDKEESTKREQEKAHEGLEALKKEH